MPTYEYQCEHCGYKFEKFQNMSDESLKEYPKCKGSAKRLINETLIFQVPAQKNQLVELSGFCLGR